MKTKLLFLLTLVAGSAFADVLEVRLWKAIPGNSAQLTQHASEARSIQQKLGGQVVVATDRQGRLHYATAHKNWVEWAAFQEKLQASDEWTDFAQKIGTAPAATLEAHYLINQVVPMLPSKVYQVYVWEAYPGRRAQLIESASTAQPLHEKLGASVGINVDQMGRVHYLMSFDTWGDWAKFQDADPTDEVSDFFAEFYSNPPGKLVEVYSVTRVD